MEKRKITLVLDDLTLGDLEAFEDATGKNLMDELTPRPVIDPNTGRQIPDPESDKGRPLTRVHISASTHMGLVYLALRRENPATTVEDARNTKLSEFEFELRSGDESPLDDLPTEETNEPESETTG